MGGNILIKMLSIIVTMERQINIENSRIAGILLPEHWNVKWYNYFEKQLTISLKGILFLLYDGKFLFPGFTKEYESIWSHINLYMDVYGSYLTL